jgi:general stress protein 26
MEATITTEKKLDELHDLIKDMNIAMFTTRRPDGSLVTRPMATQEAGHFADIWFVTSTETNKLDELETDPHVNLGYLDRGSMEWVSVSGTAKISKDRAKIHELYEPDWRMWFEDKGGEMDGGPDDPRLALILVDAESVVYLKSKYSKPRVLFELAKGMVTGKEPDIAREERLSKAELN